jgi:hypothetical protein
MAWIASSWRSMNFDGPVPKPELAPVSVAANAAPNGQAISNAAPAPMM